MDSEGVSAEAPLHNTGESIRHPAARECRNISSGTTRTGNDGSRALHVCRGHVSAGLHDQDCREITSTKADQRANELQTRQECRIRDDGGMPLGLQSAQTVMAEVVEGRTRESAANEPKKDGVRNTG